MSVAVEILEGLKRQITLKLNADEVKAEKAKRLQNIARRAKIDGYRPGKVPMKVVERNFGDQTEHEVISALINAAYSTAIQESGLKTAGYPDIRAVPEGAEYEFKASFDVMPEFELQGVEGIEVVKTEAEVTDADVDAMIATLQKQRTVWIKAERAAELNDRVTIDFEGKIDGVAFEGGAAKNTPVILGSGGMIPGFEDALIGKAVGETVTFPVTFPEDYRAENLKGKSAEFTAIIHAIEVPELPALNEDFVKAFGVASGDMSLLKEELKRNMVRELNNALQNKLKNQIMDKLVIANPIPLPESMVMNEIMALAERSQLPKAQNQEQAEQLMNIAKQAFMPEAEKRVRLGLLLSRFVELNEIKLDNAFLEARLDLTASTYEDAENVKAHFRQDENMMNSIRNMALEDQLVDALMKKANVTLETSSFDAIMKPSQG